ncbi:hypothetical protein AXG93_3217s1680 [Marchantia polymorpha subsp. ruderalis]|uniref:DNA (cytosine-5-)-methyltransferase n=1 Tax=Marchantia polymorpha subsp. ruderalis TaxID=1480154 RepID=A0A176VWH3_MARPO|nr:hypothetical protein AXG93_3217s1680 [Marchantia polymorpha subsp. ruderalis]
MSITQGGVGTRAGASGSIIEGTSGVAGAGTNSDAVSVASSSTSGEATGVPLFIPIPEFFKSRDQHVGHVEGIIWAEIVPRRPEVGVHMPDPSQHRCTALDVGQDNLHEFGSSEVLLEPCLFQIQTSLGGTNDRSYMMSRERISVQVRHDHAQDSSQFGVRAVVTSVESYDVLVGGAVLYPMGFRMDYWIEIAAYRPGWQSGDERMSELPVRFISRDRSLGSSPAVLASVAGFSGVLTWPDDLLEGNRSADDTLVHEEVEEIVSLAAAVSSPLDVPLCSSCHALQQGADRLVKKSWSEASLPAKAEQVSGGRLVCGPSTLSPLVTTHIVWEYSREGVCLLDLFGGINTGLAAVLQSAVRGYQKPLPSDISLLWTPDLDRVGHIDLVISGWPCQEHTRVGHGSGLHDSRSRMFWKMLRVLRHLKEQQTRSPAYILENVPLLSDTRAQLMASVHEMVRVADRSPMALVNRVGQPQMALPTLVSYLASHAHHDGGSGLLWDNTVHQLVEPNADERERAMRFMTSVTTASSSLQASRC